MSQVITRELVRDPIVMVFDDGKHYATQRWITRCDDWRELRGFGQVNFGWVRWGAPFPTEDSVSSPWYQPPHVPWWKRLLATLKASA